MSFRIETQPLGADITLFWNDGTRDREDELGVAPVAPAPMATGTKVTIVARWGRTRVERVHKVVPPELGVVPLLVLRRPKRRVADALTARATAKADLKLLDARGALVASKVVEANQETVLRGPLGPAFGYAVREPSGSGAWLVGFIRVARIADGSFPIKLPGAGGRTSVEILAISSGEVWDEEEEDEDDAEGEGEPAPRPPSGRGGGDPPGPDAPRPAGPDARPATPAGGGAPPVLPPVAPGSPPRAPIPTEPAAPRGDDRRPIDPSMERFERESRERMRELER